MRNLPRRRPRLQRREGASAMTSSWWIAIFLLLLLWALLFGALLVMAHGNESTRRISLSHHSGFKGTSLRGDSEVENRSPEAGELS